MLDLTRTMLVVATFVLLAWLTVGYVRFILPLPPECGTDLVRRVALPGSDWTIEETYYACGALDSGTVTIVARNESAHKSVVLARVSELVDIDLVPSGSDALTIVMPDPEDGSAYWPYRLEPNCQSDGLRVEYRFTPRPNQPRHSLPPVCPSNAP